MRITTKGRYALRAITNLAATYNGKPRPIKRIAADEDISPEFLEQIFFKLKKAGIINSVRGPGGGFLLDRDPSMISVKDIFLAVDEGIDLTPCTTCNPTNDDDLCERMDHCLVYSIWQEASDYIINYFDNISLQTVLDKNEDRIRHLLETEALRA